MVVFNAVLGRGFTVVTLVGRGFWADDGLCVGRVGLFVLTDGFFVVTDCDPGLVVGFRVGFFVVVFSPVGFLVTVEDAELVTVLFRLYTTSLRFCKDNWKEGFYR